MHPGKGTENRSATADEHAQNTLKNPNLTGILPRQAEAHRSDRARARDGAHNPHLQGSGTGGGDGGTGGDPWVTDKGSLKFSKFMYYYHPDHLGSTSFVTDANGELYEG